MFLKWGISFISCFVLVGCAVRRPVSTRVQTRIMIPHSCILNVRETPQTKCEGPDKEHIVCIGINITKIVGCEQIQVIQTKKGASDDRQ